MSDNNNLPQKRDSAELALHKTRSYQKCWVTLHQQGLRNLKNHHQPKQQIDRMKL